MIRTVDSLFRFFATEHWAEETPIDIQDALQDQLRGYLGRGFTPVLLGSGGELGSRDYALQIYHDKSGQHLELHGAFDRQCVPDIFKAAQQMKARCQSPDRAGKHKVRLHAVPRTEEMDFLHSLRGSSLRLGRG